MEQWTKWSHEGSAVNASFKPLFSASGMGTLVKVWKHPALRKVRLDPLGVSQEVPDSDHVDRGLNYELTDLEVTAPRGRAQTGLKRRERMARTAAYQDRARDVRSA
jgi:hypothetical protein